MPWFTLKVQPAHEARIRREVLELAAVARLDVKIAMPTVWTGSTIGSQAARKRGIKKGRRHLKVRPGYLFIRYDGKRVDDLVELLDGVRGIGAMHARRGVPCPVDSHLERLLNAGTFFGYGLETTEFIRL